MWEWVKSPFSESMAHCIKSVATFSWNQLVHKFISYYWTLRKLNTFADDILTLYHTVPTFNNPEKEAF